MKGSGEGQSIVQRRLHWHYPDTAGPTAFAGEFRSGSKGPVGMVYFSSLVLLGSAAF